MLAKAIKIWFFILCKTEVHLQIRFEIFLNLKVSVWLLKRFLESMFCIATIDTELIGLVRVFCSYYYLVYRVVTKGVAHCLECLTVTSNVTVAVV